MRLEGVEDDEARDKFFNNSGYQVYRISAPLAFNVTNEDKIPTFEGRMRQRWTGVKEHGVNATFEELTEALALVEKNVIES
jgi:hypothetical protein